MKQLLSKLRTKFIVSGAVIGVILGVATMANAWYPNRPTYTTANPAPHVTFNSITDNPNYGDERTFYDVKDNANQNTGGFTDSVKVQDGQTLLLRTYVHNNAADNLNTVPDGNGGFKGIAQNTKVRVHLPTASAKALRSNSYVSATNATPTEVADTVDFYGDQPFTLDYVEGSAVEYTNARPTGMALSDSIVTNGASVGYQQPDGSVPGCFEYTGIVTIIVRVSMPTPKYTVSKQVAIPGQPWTEDVTTTAGNTVSYLITFKNTGATTLNNVGIRDKLPTNMKIVPGTTTITNGNHPSGISAGTDAVVTNGIDIGSYAPNAVGYVKFKATLPAVDQLTCGTNKLVNTADAFEGSNGVVSDTANVFTNKQCQTVTPFYECSNLTLTNRGNRTVRADVAYKATNGAQFKHVTFDFGDGVKQLTNQTSYDHVYAKDGNYLVRATVAFTVNGSTQEATSENCVKSISFGSTTPTALPQTGAGDVVGLFSAVTVASGLAHRAYTGRRYS